MKGQITAEMVKELRERTGVGMSKCKEALAESGGNIDKAIEYLRKAGEMSAAKKESRVTKEGVIAFDTTPSTIALVEINAETDFVVKNEKFLAFAKAISRCAGQHKPTSLEELLLLNSGVDPTMTVDQYRNSMVQMFGENIVIKRMEIILKKQGDYSYGIYSHMNGQVVAIVEMHGSKETEALAKDIAMHIVAENPDYLKVEDVPQDIRAREEDIARSQIQNKPKEVIEKIVQGKVMAYCKQVCLLAQEYFKDSTKTVQQVVDEHSKKLGKPLSVIKFWRWKAGA